MTNEKRKLMLAICNGATQDQLHLVTQRLYYLDCFFPDDKLLHALKWLLKNKLTGYKFLEWVHDQCVNSNLEMHRELMAAVEKSNHTRILLGAKDLKNA